MANIKQRQALAIRGAARAAGQVELPGLQGRAIEALRAEASRIVKEDEAKRANGGTSLHIVGSGGVLSGFIKDAHTTVQFAGGKVALTTHD